MLEHRVRSPGLGCVSLSLSLSLFLYPARQRPPTIVYSPSSIINITRGAGSRGHFRADAPGVSRAHASGARRVLAPRRRHLHLGGRLPDAMDPTLSTYIHTCGHVHICTIWCSSSSSSSTGVEGPADPSEARRAYAHTGTHTQRETHTQRTQRESWACAAVRDVA